MKQQQGFSLLEMGIVLVIIGLILGGILGGRSLVASMQAKDVVAIVNDLRTATTYFKQRYNYLPGDFPVIAGDIANYVIPIAIGDGDGLIGGAINPAVPGSEVAEAPLQLFAAGFIDKMSSSGAQHIQSAFGAVYIASAATVGVLIPAFTTQNPAARNAIIFFSLPCSIINEVDIKIDDGIATTGRAVSSLDCNAAANAKSAAPYYAVTL